jgi:CheY-like chemotaxis protein
MKKILIVSSQSSFSERNETLLRRAAFEIFTATSSSEAMNLLVEESVDLVLIDIHLADISGESFCALVRNSREVRPPVILLVCNDSEEDHIRLNNSGADALLARPLKPMQLIKTVGHYLAVQLIRSRRVSLRVRVATKIEPVEFFCVTHNISITGMLIETNHLLKVGDLIECQFLIPGSTSPVETEGEVVRTTRTLDGAHQYGVQFTTLPRKYREEIDRYIASIVRGESKVV